MTEEILREVDSLYHYPASLVNSVLGPESILEMAEHAKLPSNDIMVPSRRVSVMFVGNHSAGKSSFINYFSGTRVQRTGTAVETQGFTIVRASMGKDKMRREITEFDGETALMQSEALQHLTQQISEKDRRDFIEHLQLRIVQPGPTANPDFAHVDLIDTPGLVDGGLNYPFDVNDAICKIAVHIADLVLIFLDPQGQALCTRTMEVVERLEKKEGCSSKMRYYITKADTVATQQDLIKVSQQITTQLAVRIRHTHGYEAPCIWIPRELLHSAPDDKNRTKLVPDTAMLGFADSEHVVANKMVDDNFDATTPDTASPKISSPSHETDSSTSEALVATDNPETPKTAEAGDERRRSIPASEDGGGTGPVVSRLGQLSGPGGPVLRQRKKRVQNEKGSHVAVRNSRSSELKKSNDRGRDNARVPSRASRNAEQPHLAYIEPANALNRVLETISHIVESRVLRNLTSLIDHSKKVRTNIEQVIEDDWKTYEQRKKWNYVWLGGYFHIIAAGAMLTMMILTPLVRLLSARVIPQPYVEYYEDYVAQPANVVLQGFFLFLGYTKTYEQLLCLFLVLGLGTIVVKISGYKRSKYLVMSSQERLKAYERVRNCGAIEKRARGHLGNIIRSAQGGHK